MPPHGSPHPGAGYRWPFKDVALTPRESEVLALLAEGLSNRDIASALYVSAETVTTHLRRVFAKLGVRSRSQAVSRALRDESFARQVRRVSHPSA